MSDVGCPDCKGAKELRALVNRGRAGCTWESIPCITCNGSGYVDKDFAERRAEGDRLREARLAANKSMADAARERGIKLSEYSDLEHGRITGASR